tara:strand:+ start:605 stop:1606 length:1002 start_codon:yes stop_codon:yes gene_type:complete
MQNNEFFVKQGPFALRDIVKVIDYSSDHSKIKNVQIHGIDSLSGADTNFMTFLNSSKYKEISLKTKAAACITSPNLSKFLPDQCIKINVKNILFAVTKVSKMFYPKADVDYPDLNLTLSDNLISIYPEVKFGKNVLIGKNVSIGKKSFIGSNSIIESNTSIGENCVIGSIVIIKNSIIKNDVHIKDGSRIGTKGFGFIPMKEKNLRTPQVGKVILHEGVEIGSNCTLDRGSITDTEIGRNTFLDNQIHIAHNVKIGENCMLAGQVGVSGSSIIGNNVMIGGQAGISGHLKIGNNVKIGGASGVTTDLADNSKVMGYPAMPMKEFARLRNKIEK